MAKTWNSTRIQEALEVLLTSHSYDDALEQLGVTSNALASAFARSGLESPTTYMAPNEQEARRRSIQKAPEGFRTIVVANDFHVPFHNKRGVRAWLELCRDLQPEIIVINGDFLDCYSISSFPKEPGKPNLQDEIDAGLGILEQLRRFCPLAEVHYTEGNHEERFKRVIKQNHGLYNLQAFTLESLLEFDRLGIKYYPYGEMLELGDLAVYHGSVTRGKSAYSARGELEQAGYQYLITGHTHRIGWYHHKTRVRNSQGLENGGLYDLSQCEYLFNPNWQNGFAVVYQGRLDDKTDVTQINPVYMQYNGAFIWGGKLYDGNM